MTLFCLGLAAVLLALLLQRHGSRRAAPMILLAAYLAPAIFLAWTFFDAREQATRFRFTLLGLGFRGEAGKPLSVAVGGDREQHGVWVSALMDRRRGKPTQVGRLVFRPATSAQEGARVVVEAERVLAPGFLAVRMGRSSSFQPVEAVELRQGDDLLTADGHTWEVRFDTGLFGPPARFVERQGKTVDLPRDTSELPLGLVIPFGRALPVSEKTYPVAWLARQAGLKTAHSPAFFFRRDGLWLVAPAGSVTLRRAGKPLAVPAAAELAAGGALHVAGFPVWNEEGFKAGGIRDRRSFRLDTGAKSFTLSYDTPEMYVLTWKQLEDLEISPPGKQAGKADPLRVNLSMGSWQITDKSLYFEHASRKVAGEALAVLELPRELAGRSLDGEVTFSAATPSGYRTGSLGRPFWLGGESLAAVQLDLLSPSLLLGLLALVLAPLKAVAARGARLTNAQLLFGLVLESLVVLRLLLGFRVWAMPPFSEEAFRLALVSWTLVPWGFLVICLPAFGQRDTTAPVLWSDRLPALGGLVFSLTWCLQLGGLGLRPLVWALCHAALLAVPVLRGIAAPRRIIDALRRRRQTGLSDRRAVWLWVGAACVPGLIRFGFFLIGAREGVPLFGQRFALTLLHVPLATILQAAYLVWLWRRPLDRGRLTKADLLPAAAFLIGTWIAPALLVSDLGMALLNVPVFLFVLAAVGFALARRLEAEGGEGSRLAWAPVAMLGFYLLFAAFPIGARALVSLVPARAELANERNYLRLLDFAYPQQLRQIARRGSEELTVMSAVMQSYTSRPWRECRYFSSEVSPHIRATVLREHAPAVFIAAEWSVGGSIGLILILLTAASAGLSLAPWRSAEEWSGWAPDRPAEVWRVIACLSALTFAIPSLYMILANYRLTLFTGKNAYLLGLDSTADVLESLALAVLFALGSAISREEEGEG